MQQQAINRIKTVSEDSKASSLNQFISFFAAVPANKIQTAEVPAKAFS